MMINESFLNDFYASFSIVVDDGFIHMDRVNAEEARRNLSLENFPADIITKARVNVQRTTERLLEDGLKSEVDSLSNFLIDNVYPIGGFSRTCLLTNLIGLMNLRTSLNAATSNVVEEFTKIFENLENLDDNGGDENGKKNNQLMVESQACNLLMDLTLIINVPEYQEKLIPYYTENVKRINKVFGRYINWNYPLATNQFIIHYALHARRFGFILRPGLEHFLSKIIDFFTVSLSKIDENVTNYRGIREKHNIVQLQTNREIPIHYDRNFFKASPIQRTLLSQAYFFILDVFHSIPAAQAILYYVRRMNRRRECICYLLYRQLRPLILNLKELQLRAELLAKPLGKKFYIASEWDEIYERLFHEILKRCTDVNKFIKSNAIDFMLWLKESSDRIPEIDDDFIQNLDYLQPGFVPDISTMNLHLTREKVTEKANSTMNIGDLDLSINLSEIREKIFDQVDAEVVNDESIKSYTETDY